MNNYKTMPKEFKNFSKCIVIIDCFEVFMERPKGLMARAQTWSNSWLIMNIIILLVGPPYSNVCVLLYKNEMLYNLGDTTTEN